MCSSPSSQTRVSIRHQSWPHPRWRVRLLPAPVSGGAGGGLRARPRGLPRPRLPLLSQVSLAAGAWIRDRNFLPTADIKGQFFLVETMGLLKQKYLDTPKNICKLAKVFEPNRILHLFSEATWIKTSYKQQMWQVTPKPEEWHHQVHSWWCYETI